jgi:31-O-methyltransferase
VTLTEQYTGKKQAIRTLTGMMVWLSNWRAVWAAYRRSQPLPPLQFRRGFTLHHGVGDDPIMLLHETFSRGCYRRYVQPPMRGVMVDLGANIGTVSLDFASLSPHLRIEAYEPNPSTLEVLRRNVAANGLTRRVTVYGEAVGQASGRLRLWSNVPSVLVTSQGSVPPASGGTSISVPMVDLNEVIRRTGQAEVSLLKIDTEGSEAAILESARPDTLMAVKRVILEYHDYLCPNARHRCQQVLVRAGFQYQVEEYKVGIGLLYAWRGIR